jgi:hypothetical protein
MRDFDAASAATLASNTDGVLRAPERVNEFETVAERV